MNKEPIEVIVKRISHNENMDMLTEMVISLFIAGIVVVLVALLQT